MSCHDLISDAMIENIYKAVDPIASNQVQTECTDDNTKHAFVEIFTSEHTSMLVHPIERNYYKEKELWAKPGEVGKVVKHEYFILDDAFRGNGIAKKIHIREMDAYRTNGFQEIQLDAAWDGLIVWKKLYFHFKSPQDESLIKIAIQRYLREIKNYGNEEIEKLIKPSPFSISMNHLKDDSIDFKDWVYSNFRKIGLAKMYKEVLQ